MLKFIVDWFDYIYYRSCLTYRFFKDDTAISPTIVVVVIKAMLIVDIGITALRIFTSQEFIDQTSDAQTTIIIVITLILIYVDYNRYKAKFDQLHEKWKDESKSQRTWKGVLVFLTFIAPWIPLVARFLMNS